MKRFLLLALSLGFVFGAAADTEMQIRNGKLTTDLNANNFKIINLQLPISPNDAASKAYVDSVVGTGGGGGGAGLPIMAGQAGKFLTTDGTIALWSLIPWSALTGQPTTLSGYGITDPVVLQSGTYSNPTWITSLGWSKITGTPTTLGGYGIATPLPLSAIPTGTSGTTVAIGNDSRFPSNVTGLRKGSGLGSLDVAAIPNTDYVTPDAAGRIALSLVPGTNVQAWDADLDSLAAFSATNIIPYRSGTNTWSAVNIGSGLTFTGGTLSTTPISGTGDLSSNVSTSVVNEVAVFADTSGKTVTRATGSGIATLTLGVLGTTSSIGPTQGGTGQTTITTGDILYGSAANVWSRLAGNTTLTNKYLRSTGASGVATPPSWQQISFTDLASASLPTTLAGYGITDALVNDSTPFSEIAVAGTQSTARQNLGLIIGPAAGTGTVEAWDADLDSLAAISTTGVIPYRSAANSWSTVSIGTGLSFTGGTLSVTSVGTGDVVGPSASVDSEVAIFSGTTGKIIKRATGNGMTKLTGGGTGGVLAIATPGIDYSSDSTGTFSSSSPGVIGTPLSWPSGATSTTETGNLAIDGYAQLPLANAYQPGRRIVYTDSNTTGNFGRWFRAASGDFLNGIAGGGGTYFRAFIGADLGVYGSKSVEFVTDGVHNWTAINGYGTADHVEDPTNVAKRFYFDASNQDGITPGIVTAGLGTAYSPNTYTYAATDPAVPGVLLNANLGGTFTKGQLHPTDTVPTELVIGTFGNPVVPSATPVPNANPGTVDTVRVQGILTNPYTLTWPDAAHYSPGETITIVDSSGTVSTTNPITVVPANGTDKFNINQNQFVFDEPFGRKAVTSDGSSNWTVSITKTATAPFDVITPSTRDYVINTNQSSGKQNAHINLQSGQNNILINGQFDGAQYELVLVQPSSGAAGTVTLPAGSRTPSGGKGLLILSSANGAIDRIRCSYDAAISSFLWDSPILDETSAVVPAAPSGFSATSDSVLGGTINLAWTDNSNNETKFQILRAPGAIGTTGFVVIKETLGNVTSYQDTGLSNNTTYTYRVKACNTGGCSNPSADDDATTLNIPSTQADIYENHFNQGSGTTSPNTVPSGSPDTALSTAAWVAHGSGFAFNPIVGMAGMSGFSASVGAGSGTATYKYRVVAFKNSVGTHNLASLEQTVSSAPNTLNAANYCTLSWTAVTGAESYKIYRTSVAGNTNSPVLDTGGLTGSVPAGTTTFNDTGIYRDTGNTQFNVTTDIYTATYTGINYGTNDQLTITFWVKGSFPISSFIASAGYTISINNTARLQVSFPGTGSTALTAGTPYAALNDGNWHLVAIEMDNHQPAYTAGNDLKIYYDNNSTPQTLTVTNNSRQGPQVFASGNLLIGSSLWAGAIDDVRVFSGLLTTTQIGTIYSNGAQ